MANNDLLIKLHDPQWFDPTSTSLNETGIRLRKPIGPDRTLLLDWAEHHFPTLWIDEIQRALSNQPVSCWLAQRTDNLLGFACYDATALGFFGPLGVIDSAQGQGIGSALTRACLHEMHLKGYRYAIVGRTHSDGFYRRIAPTITIADSDPGCYADTLQLKRARSGEPQTDGTD
ncbi:MAG: GNAT family N-acetyltransferase [Candidatus Thiodiazotropha sp.]